MTFSNAVKAETVPPVVPQEVNTADFDTIKLRPVIAPVIEQATREKPSKEAVEENREESKAVSDNDGTTVVGGNQASSLNAVQPEVAPASDALADSLALDKPRAIADASAVSRGNDFVPIDLTPVRLPERVSTFNNFENFKAHALYRLPGRVFFNASVENSLRFELNTFQTDGPYLSDMIYRVLPNVNLGYALSKRTRVSANYFFFRDQYDKRDSSLSRNIHSVGGQLQHDVPINQKTQLTFTLFPRALFINTVNAPSVAFYDIIPSATISRRVGMSGVIYGSVLGQIRFRDPFSNFQEGDQFYSAGGVWRKGPWSYLFDTTLVTNFGNRRLRGGPNNQVIIITGEIGRRLNPRLPVTAFVRAEPIFNMGANGAPGFSGFNFRVFGGLRAEVAKPAIFPIKLKG
ncbi:MAG: hypothetical protein K2Y32_21085 [Candidatus Obscuribacterales bacterium]|nr:hypothetical protein [Candidatus Obscuribacterales bacterium]